VSPERIRGRELEENRRRRAHKHGLCSGERTATLQTPAKRRECMLDVRVFVYV
jgi:hypothetical protein